MYNHDLTLISYTATKDAIGNKVKTPIKNVVLCRIKGITEQEFYNAATTELKPEMKFVIHDFEYSGQKKVEYKSQEYKVIRTYQPDQTVGARNYSGLQFDEIELTCERVVG